MRPSGLRRARRVPVALLGPLANSRPEPSIQAENPVFAAIASGVRTSTARKIAAVRCMSSSLDPAPIARAAVARAASFDEKVEIVVEAALTFVCRD